MTEEEGHPICDVCGVWSQIREMNGHRYCYNHHMMYCTAIKHEKMVSLHEQGIDSLERMGMK